MLTIEDKKIYFTRGDTGYFTIGMEGYEPTDGDKLVFTVKKEIGGEKLIQKTINIGETFILNPEDTRDLDYGKYWYDHWYYACNRRALTIPKLWCQLALD